MVCDRHSAATPSKLMSLCGSQSWWQESWVLGGREVDSKNCVKPDLHENYGWQEKHAVLFMSVGYSIAFNLCRMNSKVIAHPHNETHRRLINMCTTPATIRQHPQQDQHPLVPPDSCQSASQGQASITKGGWGCECKIVIEILCTIFVFYMHRC